MDGRGGMDFNQMILMFGLKDFLQDLAKASAGDRWPGRRSARVTRCRCPDRVRKRQHPPLRQPQATNASACPDHRKWSAPW